MTKATENLKVEQHPMSAASKATERASIGWYKLHNDADSPVAAVIANGRDGGRLRVLVIPPDGTSDQFDDGTHAFFLWATGAAEVYDCTNGTVWAHFHGDLRGNQVNNVSSFQ
ncbi:hypothetical protein [Nocardia sp. NPDC047038]|uniref:hypothetical protein n=1 Tax=Nocardia sp. NPDC047038 TaxID=3154338 RepID=UPI0033DB42F8